MNQAKESSLHKKRTNTRYARFLEPAEYGSAKDEFLRNRYERQPHGLIKKFQRERVRLWKLKKPELRKVEAKSGCELLVDEQSPDGRKHCPHDPAPRELKSEIAPFKSAMFPDLPTQHAQSPKTAEVIKEKKRRWIGLKRGEAEVIQIKRCKHPSERVLEELQYHCLIIVSDVRSARKCLKPRVCIRNDI